jgi:thiol-disulfide isomerase/thioredoxin
MFRNNTFSLILNLLLLILLGASASQLSAQETSPSRLIGLEAPTAGSTLHMIYNPADGPLDGYKDIRVIAYLFENYQWKTNYFKLSAKDGTYPFDFQVPDDCGFIALKFLSIRQGKQPVSDNNDDYGFISTVLSNNEVVPGGNLAWGIFRMPALGHGVPAYFNQFTISNDALEFWVKKEVQKYGQNLPKFFDSYLAAAKQCAGDRYQEIAPKLIGQFLSDYTDLPEEKYIQIRNIYRFDLKDTVKANEVDVLIRKKFPNGQAMRFDSFNKAYMVQDNRTEKMEAFLHDFPVSEWHKDLGAGNQGYMYNKIYQALATGYYEKQEITKMLSLLPDMNYSTLIDTWHWTIDRSFKMKLSPLPQIYRVSKEILKELQAKIDDNSYAQAFCNMPWVLEKHTLDLMDKKLARYIEILEATGKYEEAPAYFAQISDSKKYTTTALNEAYVHVLQKIGSRDELVDFLENAVRSNAVTTDMNDLLKKFYLEKHSNGNFEAYLNSLKNNEKHNAFIAELKKNLVKIPYKPFELSGPNGLKVNSNDFKNKIVVIDFWATWCAPCKKSFPGMQLAVNKYAEDKNVKFYFLSTMEVDKNFKKNSQAYLKENNYNFQQLFDEPNSRNGSHDRVFSTFSSIFNSSGIPRKVILKDGYIRYTAEGYSGSPSKLLDEISTVVDLLKTENE